MRIAFSEIVNYCAFMKFDFVRSQDFLIYVENMDSTYMEYVAEKHEEMKNKPTAK